MKISPSNIEEGRNDLPNGLIATAHIERDEDMGPPWEEHDGHGIVSEWTRRDKHAGEWLLHSDNYDRRYYDFAATMKLARKDGWGLDKDDVALLERKLGRNPTKREITEEAVLRDFEYLRRWCNDEWYWIGAMVRVTNSDGEPIGEDSTWGFESEGEYWKEVAAELIEQITNEYETETNERDYWASRDIETGTHSVVSQYSV